MTADGPGRTPGIAVSSASPPSWGRRGVLAAGMALALVLGLIPGGGSASADSAPEPPERVATVTADSLPTVQVDGVVWDQLIVGNTVYVTGSFRYARPAGARPNESRVRRAGALAYDIRTGKLDSRWRPRLNGPGRSLAVSSDGSRIFIGGDFTKVNGSSRSKLVAVHPRTGSVISGFRVRVNSRVNAIAVSGTTVYIGGTFTNVSGRSRQRLAALRATNGALLTWAPRADDAVYALAVPRGVGNVVVGGRMSRINGVLVRGMGSVDARTGRVRTWLVNRVLRNYGPWAAITSLSTDGRGSGARVFGSGYYYKDPLSKVRTTIKPTKFENTFRARARDGKLVWVNGCRGDTYDAVPVGEVLYSAGHPHFCKMIRGFPETPEESRLFQRVLATTTARDGINDRHLLKGQPAPRLLHWFPTVNQGNVTGQNQGAWTIEANADYVLIGGEFTEVNRSPQQGLARFAVRRIAPNAQGPQGYDELKPKVIPAPGGAVHVRWTSSYDRDNRALTQQLLRGPTSSTAQVVAARKANAAWWDRPPLGATDTGLEPGSTQTYRVRAVDALGNKLTGAPVQVTIPSGPVSSAYRDAVKASGPSAYWRLDETSGTRSYDWAGWNDLALSKSVRLGRPGGIVGDPDTAAKFPGTAGVHAVSGVRWYSPQTLTLEAWVRTRTTSGGKIVGFGNKRTGDSTRYDRHLYMDDRGRVTFGVYKSGYRRVTSAPGLNDGTWHHLVGTFGSDGVSLYVDGTRVGRDPRGTSAITYQGYWRIGGDKLGRWPDSGSSSRFRGDIDEVAVYRRVLPAAEVASHFAKARNLDPTASFTAAATGLTVQVDGSGSSDPEGQPLVYGWDFGDGATGTGVTASHTYAASGTYTVRLTVTDGHGASATTTQMVSVTAPNLDPTASFTATATGLTVQVDGSGSSDPEGQPLVYGWDFGDGATGTGVTASHTYAASGTYTVRLTVTDVLGASGAATLQIQTGP